MMRASRLRYLGLGKGSAARMRLTFGSKRCAACAFAEPGEPYSCGCSKRALRRPTTC
jgi:hypothetical protein